MLRRVLHCSRKRRVADAAERGAALTRAAVPSRILTLGLVRHSCVEEPAERRLPLDPHQQLE